MKNSKYRFLGAKMECTAGLRGKNRWRIWTKDLSPEKKSLEKEIPFGNHHF